MCVGVNVASCHERARRPRNGVTPNQAGGTVVSRLKDILPAWQRPTMPPRQQLMGDLTAGVIASVLMVPQGMAYAMIAGLPPVVGLYAAVLPPIIYAISGSSNGLSVGPTSVVAIMTAAVLASPNLSGDPLPNAIMLTALAGMMLAVMGLLRLGMLANLLSQPVLAGFTSGAAIVIIIDQLKHVFGIPMQTGLPLQDVVAEIYAQWRSFDLASLGLGLAGLGFLWLASLGGLRRWLAQQGPIVAELPSRLAPLALIVAATLIVALPVFDGIARVGKIEVSLPTLGLTLPEAEDWIEVLPSAALVAFIIFVESVSIGQFLALRRRERINADRELIALGGANLASALSGAMPVAGSFSRSMINVEAGAQTRFSSVVMALIVAAALALLAGLFSDIPLVILSAIIIVAVLKLIDFNGVLRSWRYSKADGWTQLVTLFGVLIYGVEAGLVMGVVLSLVLYIWRTGRPHIVVVGRVPETGEYRSVERYETDPTPGVLIVRIDENLYFANVGYIGDILRRELAKRPGIKHLIFMMSGVGFIDGSALRSLETAIADLNEAGITLHLAEMKGHVHDRIVRTDLFQMLHPGRVFTSTHAAAAYLVREDEREKELTPL